MLQSPERSSLKTRYFGKSKRSPTCRQCGKEQKFVYLCSKCGAKLCKEHRKPEHHECLKKEVHKPNKPIIRTDPKPLIQESTQPQTEKMKKKQVTRPSLRPIHQATVKNKIKFRIHKPKKKKPFLKRYAIPIAFICTLGIIVGISGIFILLFASNLVPFY
jgi:hypothetical protein